MPSTNPKTYESTPPPQGRLSRPGRDGLSHGRASGAGRARRDGLQPQRGQGRRPGPQEFKGSSAATPREARGRRATSCSAASATTTTCARWCWAPDGAFAGMKPGAIFIDHTTASANVARELFAKAAKARAAFRRRAGVGRPGGRAERHAHGDVRRRRGRVRGGQAGGDGLCPRLHAAGRARRRPARQDGQPDRHRRPGAGPVGGDRLRPEGRPGHGAGAGSDRQGRRPELADGQPRQDHDRGQVRLTASPSTGCARTWAWCSTRPSATARGCRSRRWSTSSTPTCRPWAAGAGTRPA